MPIRWLLRDWLNHLGAGSNSDKILREAPCPVLVIPDAVRKPFYIGSNSVWPQAREAATAMAQERPLDPDCIGQS